MSTLQTTQSTTTQPRDARAITPILRPSSAADAPWFAQVLQGFDRDERSLVVESASQSESETPNKGIESSADEATDGADTQQGDEEHVERPDPTAGDQQVGSNSKQGEAQLGNDGKVGEDAAPGTEAGRANQTAIESSPERQAHHQRTSGQSPEISRLDPLQNKSDQAKLSIKGFIRASRAEAAPDLTTMAVQTRLGEIEPTGPRDQSRQIDRQPASDGIQPGGVRPAPTPLGNPTHNPLDSISDTPPDTSNGKGNGAGLRVDPNQPNPVNEAPRAKIDPSQGEAQQTRSMRSEAATAVTNTREQPLVTRADALQSLIRSGVNAKAEGAITARAVTAVDGGVRAGIEASTAKLTQSPSPIKSDSSALQEKMIAQVQRGLASLLRSSDSEMTLRLTPERLGELRIQIKREGDRIALRLTTQSAEARDLLQSGSDELARALQSKGVQVERVLIEHSATGPGQQGGFDADGQHSGNHGADQQHHGHSEQPTQPDLYATHDDETAVGPRGIWTELGLDAIA